MFAVVLVGLALNRCVPLSRTLSTSESTDGGDAASNCMIKGNISLSGERIYHVPGGKWYSKTRIDHLEGERWFCSEREARRAGWRKSYE